MYSITFLSNCIFTVLLLAYIGLGIVKIKQPISLVRSKTQYIQSQVKHPIHCTSQVVFYVGR